MLDKLRPFIASIFCVALSLITLASNGQSPAFFCFLPACFFFVGDYLNRLRKDNLALRSRIDDLSSQLTANISATR